MEPCQYEIERSASHIDGYDTVCITEYEYTRHEQHFVHSIALDLNCDEDSSVTAIDAMLISVQNASATPCEHGTGTGVGDSVTCTITEMAGTFNTYTYGGSDGVSYENRYMAYIAPSNGDDFAATIDPSCEDVLVNNSVQILVHQRCHLVPTRRSTPYNESAQLAQVSVAEIHAGQATQMCPLVVITPPPSPPRLPPPPPAFPLPPLPPSPAVPPSPEDRKCPYLFMARESLLNDWFRMELSSTHQPQRLVEHRTTLNNIYEDLIINAFNVTAFVLQEGAYESTATIAPGANEYYARRFISCFDIVGQHSYVLYRDEVMSGTLPNLLDYVGNRRNGMNESCPYGDGVIDFYDIQMFNALLGTQTTETVFPFPLDLVLARNREYPDEVDASLVDNPQCPLVGASLPEESPAADPTGRRIQEETSQWAHLLGSEICTDGDIVSIEHLACDDGAIFVIELPRYTHSFHLSISGEFSQISTVNSVESPSKADFCATQGITYFSQYWAQTVDHAQRASYALLATADVSGVMQTYASARSSYMHNQYIVVRTNELVIREGSFVSHYCDDSLYSRHWMLQSDSILYKVAEYNAVENIEFVHVGGRDFAVVMATSPIPPPPSVPPSVPAPAPHPPPSAPPRPPPPSQPPSPHPSPPPSPTPPQSPPVEKEEEVPDNIAGVAAALAAILVLVIAAACAYFAMYRDTTHLRRLGERVIVARREILPSLPSSVSVRRPSVAEQIRERSMRV